MWYLWEASNVKFSFVCEIREMVPWKMRESKEDEILCAEDARSKLMD